MCVESTVHLCVTGNAGKCDVETAAAQPNQSTGIRASRSRRPSSVIPYNCPREREVQINHERLIGTGESERVHTPARLKALSDEAELRAALTLVTSSPVIATSLFFFQPVYASYPAQANTLTKRCSYRKVVARQQIWLKRFIRYVRPPLHHHPVLIW